MLLWHNWLDYPAVILTKERQGNNKENILHIRPLKRHMPAANWPATRALFNSLSLDFSDKEHKATTKESACDYSPGVLVRTAASRTHVTSFSLLPLVASFMVYWFLDRYIVNNKGPVTLELLPSSLFRGLFNSFRVFIIQHETQ